MTNEIKHVLLKIKRVESGGMNLYNLTPPCNYDHHEHGMQMILVSGPFQSFDYIHCVFITTFGVSSGVY